MAVFSGKWWQKRLVSIHHRVIDVRSLDSSQRNMPMTHPSNSRPQWGEILYEIELYLFFINLYFHERSKGQESSEVNCGGFNFPQRNTEKNFPYFLRLVFKD